MLWKLEDSSGRWGIIESSCLNKEIWYQIFSRKTLNLAAHVVRKAKQNKKTPKKTNKNPPNKIKPKPNGQKCKITYEKASPFSKGEYLIFYIDGFFRE